MGWHKHMSWCNGQTVPKKRTNDELDHREVATFIQHTVNEETLDFGKTYTDCFKGVDRRRTEIVAWCAQQAAGFIVQGYQTYFCAFRPQTYVRKN